MHAAAPNLLPRSRALPVLVTGAFLAHGVWMLPPLQRLICDYSNPDLNPVAVVPWPEDDVYGREVLSVCHDGSRHLFVAFRVLSRDESHFTIRTYDWRRRPRSRWAPFSSVEEWEFQPHRATGKPFPMAVYQQRLILLELGCGRALQFVDLRPNPGSGQRRDRLDVSPVHYPPAWADPALFFAKPQAMTVAGDRLWIADGCSLRSFALATGATGSVQLTPLAFTPLDDVDPRLLCAVELAGGSARLFVNGLDEVSGEGSHTATCLLSDGGGDATVADSKAPAGVCAKWQVLTCSPRPSRPCAAVLVADEMGGVVVYDPAAGARVLRRIKPVDERACSAAGMAVVGDLLVMATAEGLYIRADCIDF